MVLLLVTVAPPITQARKVKRPANNMPLAAVRRRHHATVIDEAVGVD